ncbi:MAG: hypothetical protein PHX54_11730, partial [Lentimicrobiaceae bacterium]|nr:hypothetical protein [Lentimicrobiaceae bacterium]
MMHNIVRHIKIMLGFVLVLSLSGCSGKDNSTPPDEDDPPGGKGKIQFYLTRGDESKRFNHEAALSFRQGVTAGYPVIEIDTSQRFQEIEGFGAALTGSAAYLLHRKMDETARRNILNELFDPQQGIGLTYLRLTMGASDFSLNDYTYNDLRAGGTDFALEKFSLAEDREDVLPVLKDILRIAPGITLMGSPWSPPAWMKTNGSLKGGRLKPECYAVYSNYFVKYIQAMHDEGIAIDAVTVQNEPLHFTANYPCMEMQANEQLTFIKDNLGPAFSAA